MDKQRCKWTVNLPPLKSSDDLDKVDHEENLNYYFGGLWDTIHEKLGTGDDEEIVTISNFKINQYANNIISDPDVLREAWQ
jgi:hypothetical protein